MPLFPMFADLSDREVLVVGGGEVAARKIEALLHAGARVQVHAEACNGAISRWCEQGRVRRREGEFDPNWLDQAWLLVAATDDRAFNARLAAEAGRRRRLANIVDDAELSTFQVPAIVDRAPLLVAISSGGAAPMLARRLRERLEALLDHSLGDFAGLFARHRGAIRQRLPQLIQRRRWMEQVIDGPVPVLLQAGEQEAAEEAFQDALRRGPEMPVAGSVVLVGAGSGDPGLLTLKALRALNQVDLLVCDAALGPAVPALARRDAARLAMPVDDDARLDLLARHAGAGERVVCVGAGDPFRRPPGDRLPRQLAERGIACEVIAGVVP
ncbi:NAD(P)-dependent oxidoreductase [Luteimonas salinilitoris]|uniref:precorrin-2 dehydrogenase n=1 Tax=Luteimonas salinilitoris TaxID=3237697 RepID=A0ABV4HRB9_9GAMM